MSSIQQILEDPATSGWLRDALRSAMTCDAVTVANDAELLLRALHERVAAVGQADEAHAAANGFPRAWVPGLGGT